MKLSITMTRRERIWGWILMASHFTALPIIAMVINEFLPKPLTITELNFALFVAEALLALIFFRKFLAASTKIAFQAPFRCLRCAFYGFILYYMCSILIGIIIGFINIEFTNANDSNIQQMAQENFLLIHVSTVLLAPFTEELLYRGLLFGSLQHKNRVLAYVVSTAVFCLIHVVGYIGSVPTSALLLSLLQYIPAGLSLAWAYERADSIWGSMLMHMAINQISVSLMR